MQLGEQFLIGEEYQKSLHCFRMVLSVLPEKFDRSYKRWIRKAGKKKGKKRKKDTNSEEGAEEDDGQSEKKKQKKVMPNYFIAVQITNPKVSTGVAHRIDIPEKFRSFTKAIWLLWAGPLGSFGRDAKII